MFKQRRLISTIITLSVILGSIVPVLAETEVDTTSEKILIEETDRLQLSDEFSETDEQPRRTSTDNLDEDEIEETDLNENKKSIYETNKIINENIGDTQSDASVERSSANATSSIPDDFSIESVSTPGF